MMIDFLSLKLERIIPLSRRRPSRISSRLFASSASSASRVGARARVSFAPAAIPRRPSSPSSRSRHDSTFIFVPSRRALP